MIAVLALASVLRAADGARPLERFVLGPGVDLTIDAGLSAELAEPVKTWRATHDAAERLDAAVAPVFQTWYGRDEILAMLGWLVRHPGVEVDAAFRMLQDRGADAAHRDPAAAQALGDAARADAEVRNNLSGLTRVLFSPFLTRALLANAGRIAACLDDFEAGREPAAPCLQIPVDPRAAVVKLRWMPLDQMFPLFPADSAAMLAQYRGGSWLPSAWLTSMPNGAMRVQRLPSGQRFGLVAMHLMVKSGAAWHWQSTWFGGNLCAVSGFTFAPSEGDPLYDALAADRGDRSWCSNPYMETEPRAARTNCVGCHQHAGSELDPTAILGRPDRFPADASSAMTSGGFDHLWSLTAGGQLAHAFRQIMATHE